MGHEAKTKLLARLEISQGNVVGSKYFLKYYSFKSFRPSPR